MKQNFVKIINKSQRAPSPAPGGAGRKGDWLGEITRLNFVSQKIMAGVRACKAHSPQRAHSLTISSMSLIKSLLDNLPFAKKKDDFEGLEIKPEEIRIEDIIALFD